MVSIEKFPVTSPTACLLKWGWSTILLYSGQSNSCHRTTLSQLTSDSIHTFHNTPEKIEQRRIMRDGGWPARGNGCECCADIEESGGMSDRTTNLALLVSDPQQQKLVPLELLQDPDALEVTPTMLEVYFTNRCNMSCIYCGPDYSTRWVAENARFGSLDHHTRGINAERVNALNADYPKKLENFWRWLDDNYKNLRMFNVLGGEPFYQKETEQTIRFWADHPNPDLHLKIFSNLKVGHKKFVQLVNSLKALHDSNSCASVGICASLDGWGSEQMYIRTGLNLANWQKNFEYLIYAHPWADVSINSTINALSVRTMPALLRKMRDWKVERAELTDHLHNVPQISWVFNMLLGPDFMHAGIFEKGFLQTISNRPSNYCLGIANGNAPTEPTCAASRSRSIARLTIRR